DRVVPRAETKPGRFARAIAAVEEGRSDEATEGSDSADDGWKSRIGFPSKKKKKQEEDEAEVYKPVNREARTAVERPAVREMAPREEGRLDVAALAAAAGLPKDVTPEELAALAAAAAQVQAAVDGREPMSAAPQGGFEGATQAAEKAETKVDATVETQIESKIESQPEAQAVRQSAQPEAGEIAAGATFAQQGADETAAAVNVTAKESKPAAAVRDFDVIATPEIEKRNDEEKHSDEAGVPVTMAVAAAGGAGYVSVGSTTHRWTAVPVAIAAEEAAVSLELEMQKAYAAFAAAEANQPGFVTSQPATPLAENSISAAMVEAPAGPVPDEEEIARTLRDVAHASVEAVDSSLAKLEAVAEAQEQPAAGNGQMEEPSAKLGETHTEIVAAAARDLEAKRELEAREREAQEREAKEAEAREREAQEREAKEVEAREREAQEREAKEVEAREREAREREAKEAEAREREAQEREAKEAEAREREAREREAKEIEAREREAQERAAREQVEAEAAAAQAAAEAASAAAALEQSRAAELLASEQNSGPSVEASVVCEPSVAATAEEVANASASPVAGTEPPPTEAAAGVSEGPVSGKEKEKVAGGEMAEKRESDLAATTAAAWASWRQIRESGDKPKATGSAKSNQQDDDDDEYPELPPDRAAMAAAAGAEKSPEEPAASTDDPADIANIVDKVLADLRPKIAEEISKKLKEK
ncbi:MAG: hypothetical protein WBQ08_22110, partial [Candidatus Sulfotelmatobacter sp.]